MEPGETDGGNQGTLARVSDIVVAACPQDHEGYPKAEVTGGGVPLEQVDCKTMESRVSYQVAMSGLP